MRYSIVISKAARRDLKRLRGTIVRRIADAIDALADDPRPAGSIKLTGKDELYRIRVADYRVLYELRRDRLIVLVLRIGHRRDVYRKGK